MELPSKPSLPNDLNVSFASVDLHNSGNLSTSARPSTPDVFTKGGEQHGPTSSTSGHSHQFTSVRSLAPPPCKNVASSISWLGTS